MALNPTQSAPLVGLITRQKVVEEPAYVIDKSILDDLLPALNDLMTINDVMNNPKVPLQEITEVQKFIKLIDAANEAHEKAQVPQNDSP